MEWKESKYLSVLAQSNKQVLNEFVDSQLIPQIPQITVLDQSCGLVMIPSRDTITDCDFFLGEALVTRAKVELENHQGFGMCLGRDFEKAIAIAIIDACIQERLLVETINTFLLNLSITLQNEKDEERKLVESTRVQMETF